MEVSPKSGAKITEFILRLKMKGKKRNFYHQYFNFILMQRIKNEVSARYENRFQSIFLLKKNY